MDLCRVDLDVPVLSLDKSAMWGQLIRQHATSPNAVLTRDPCRKVGEKSRVVDLGVLRQNATAFRVYQA